MEKGSTIMRVFADNFEFEVKKYSPAYKSSSENLLQQQLLDLVFRFVLLEISKAFKEHLLAIHQKPASMNQKSPPVDIDKVVKELYHAENSCPILLFVFSQGQKAIKTLFTVHSIYSRKTVE